MLIALALVVVFGLLGLQFTTKHTDNPLLLAPALGLAALVLLAYIISLNFHVAGGPATGYALFVLIATTLGKLWFNRKMAWTHNAWSRRAIGTLLLSAAPALVLLVPAMQRGIESFFGAVNFDFFYNSQDAWFLATHPVTDFASSTSNEVLPLDWSANAQGRFAISLIGAFALKYLGANPLHFNSELLSALIIVSSFTAYAFAQRVLGLGFWLSGVATVAFILSGGFSQGYNYYLLGQISAIPLFMLICLYGHKLLEKIDGSSTEQKPIWAEVFLLALLLNALFVFYAILSVFAAVILLTAAVLQGVKRTGVSGHAFSRGMFVLACGLGFFLLIRILSLNEAKRTVMGWITLSLKTAGANSNAPAVFTEYVTESFLSLFLGVFRYPTNASLFNDFLGMGTSRSWILLLLGVLAFVILLWSIIVFSRSENTSNAMRSVVLALTLISIPSALLFFATQSGYAIFKIGSWLIPILLMTPVAAMGCQRGPFRWRKVPLIAAVLLLCLSNTATAINYSYAFMRGIGFEKYENSENVNGLIGVDQLKLWLQNHAERPLAFDLSDGIKTAWIANEFRDKSVGAIAHNLQPLEDKVLPNQPCSSAAYTLPLDGVLIADGGWNDKSDILSIYPEQKPDFSNAGYSTYLVSNIDHYAFLGRGAYQAYTLPEEQARQIGFPATFRWLERGMEVFVYSARPASIDIDLTAAPGYVGGPPDRTIQISGAGIERSAIFKKNATAVHFGSIELNKGTSCFFIESKDETTPAPRYGALFRSTVQMDSRYLNFVVGNLQVRFMR